ncbi:MAG: ThuA domain-containing protein [Solirubrobacterales bacterium]
MRPRNVLRALAVAVVALAGMLLAGAATGTAKKPAADEQGFDVLVFSRTTAFRHVSIETGIATIKELGETNGFRVEATEDPAQFTLKKLKRFEAVVFLSTTGTVLEDPQRRAFMKYVRRGGGYVGIHSAADTEYEWPFYGRLVGAYFLSHPLQQTATFTNEAVDHPATAHIEPRFTTLDEFYSFRTNPRADVRVLLSIDESTYSPDPNTTDLPGGTPTSGVMGDHPMSWCHDNIDGRRGAPGGRAFYTALGHENYLYELEWYRRHLLGGILTAARQVEADCSATRH